MPYTVIARKCRPQTFDEVVGQEHVTRTLKNAIAQQRIGLPVLFTGERGVGKTSVARILAKALNCHQGTTVEPCGACVSCREIADGVSMDVHEIDGASNTGVEHIRVLRENARYRPSRDRYKIYIIDEVHMLSTSAFNALLKTLEEPPDHVVFMFATTEPEKIPDTILSRCLRFDFKRIAVARIAQHLATITSAEQVQISDHALYQIAREADGSMRDAQTLLERVLSYCGTQASDSDVNELLGNVDRRLLYRIMDAVIDGDTDTLMATLAEVYAGGTDIRKFFARFLYLVRDSLMAATCADASVVLDLADDDLQLVQELASRAGRDRLLQLLRLGMAAEADIHHALTPRIALELCLLEMAVAAAALPFAEVLDRVEQLACGATPVAVIDRPAPHADGPARPAISPAAGGDLKAFISGKWPPAAMYLSQAQISIEGDQVVFSAPAGARLHQWLADETRRERIAALCGECLGRAVGVRGETAAEKKKSAAVSVQQTRTEILGDPLVRKLTAAFDATVVDIHVPGQDAGA